MLDRNLFKRFRNTNCSFQITFKVLRNNENYFSCYVFFEHCHYDAVNSRKTLSFKMFSIEIKIEIEALFSRGIAPSRAFNEFLRNLQSNSEDELNFHLRKDDRSKCPRRRDFNSSYIKCCQAEFRGKYAAINLRKELMSLRNLTAMLRFLSNISKKILTQHSSTHFLEIKEE